MPPKRLHRPQGTPPPGGPRLASLAQDLVEHLPPPPSPPLLASGAHVVRCARWGFLRRFARRVPLGSGPPPPGFGSLSSLAE